MLTRSSYRTNAQRGEGLLEPTSQAYKESVFDTQDELGSLVQNHGRGSKRRAREEDRQISSQRKRHQADAISRDNGRHESDEDEGSQEEQSSQAEGRRASGRSNRSHNGTLFSDDMPPLDDHSADSPRRNTNVLRSALTAEERSEDGFEGEDDPETRKRWARMDAQKDVFLKKRQGKENFPAPRVVASVITPNMSEGSRSQAVRGGKTRGRQFWTREETECLLQELRRVAMEKRRNPRLQVYAAILEMHGRAGSDSDILERYNSVQLKDKARNELIRMKRDGQKLPFWKRSLFPNIWVSR